MAAQTNCGNPSEGDVIYLAIGGGEKDDTGALYCNRRERPGSSITRGGDLRQV